MFANDALLFVAFLGMISLALSFAENPIMVSGFFKVTECKC